jgi:hypothetical protein
MCNYVRTYTYIHKYKYAYSYICMYIGICIYIYIYICIHNYHSCYTNINSNSDPENFDSNIDVCEFLKLNGICV